MTGKKKCPICNSPEFSKLKLETQTSRIQESGGKNLLKCGLCNIIFPESFPEIVYEKDFYNEKKKFGGSAGGDIKPHPHLIERLNLIEIHFRPKSSLDILEVGCSTGVFLEYARDRGHNVKGIEISEYAGNIAISKGLDVFIGKLEDSNIPTKSVDFIHLNHVLEHLPNPLSSLLYLGDCLRDGGIIVIEVPNEFENFQYITLRHLKPRSLIRVTPTQHSYFFNPKSLSYLLKTAGYNGNKIKTPSRVNSRIQFVKALGELQDKLLLGKNIEIWGSLKK